MKLVESQSGHYLLHDGLDIINTRLMQGKPWEPLTQSVARLFVDRADKPVVVDVGANLGAFAVPLGGHIQKRGGTLHAFEAQRMVYYQLCANLLLNGLGNCFAHHFAIGRETGRIDVPVLDLSRERNIGSLSLDPTIRKMQGTLSTLSNHSESVAMRPLDSLDLPKASLVKIDVEGMELDVLQGAQNWLRQSGYPPLLFEVWGDYMPGYIEKRERLKAFVRTELGYHIDQLGELAVAQHPSRMAFRIEQDDRQIRFVPLQASPVASHI